MGQPRTAIRRLTRVLNYASFVVWVFLGAALLATVDGAIYRSDPSRAMAILAVVATIGVCIVAIAANPHQPRRWHWHRDPATWQLTGAGLVVAAITAALAYPGIWVPIIVVAFWLLAAAVGIAVFAGLKQLIYWVWDCAGNAARPVGDDEVGTTGHDWGGDESADAA